MTVEIEDAVNAAYEKAASIIDRQDVDPAFKHRMSSAVRSLITHGQTMSRIAVIGQNGNTGNEGRKNK